MKSFAQYKSNGKIWPAGKTILGLCAAWNYATDPSAPMSEIDHARSFVYARAIKARMMRLGYRHGTHYRELSNGALFPVKA
jgi:hypothetical protein